MDQLHLQMTATAPTNKFKLQDTVSRPWLRGSDLPMCQTKMILDTVRKTPRFEHTTFMSDFYTKSGSTIHEILQKWFGVSGILYGKYECPSCKKLYPTGSTIKDGLGVFGPVFCDCQREHICCEYVEFSPENVKWSRAFRGHVDAVFKINNKYCIGEFKTTDTKKITLRRQHGPDPKHELQAIAYRHVMPTFLNIDEKLWWDHSLIIYYDRANPRTNVVLASPYRPELFEAELAKYKAARNMIKTSNYKEMTRLCSNINDNKYCPYNALCFSPQRETLISSLIKDS
jgi:hypothetical protein